MKSLADNLYQGVAPTTENVSLCPLCNSTKSEFLFWNFDRLYHLPGKFGLILCNDCELVRLSPRPKKESIGFYYPEDLFYSYQEATVSIRQISSTTGTVAKLREYIRQMVLSTRGYPVKSLTRPQKLLRGLALKFFFKRGTYGWGERFPVYKEGGRVLDIGSGNGTFLSFLKHHGWDVQGLDVSQRAAEVAKKNFDIDVHVGDLADAPFEDASFDHINMSHVLEHVYDPIETIKDVHRLLRLGGTVYIEVPNYQSYSRKQSREFWYAWESPRHIFTFSPKNLRTLLESNGFSVLKLETKRENLFAWDNTYRLEETIGEKATRPLVRAQDAPRLAVQGLGARVSHAIDPSSGDFICCWATKTN